jgi:Nitronate monooxygenase
MYAIRPDFLTTAATAVGAAPSHSLARSDDRGQSRDVVASDGSIIRTRLTQHFGIRHPVVGAPMAYFAGGTLAAAVSRVGGLGIVGGGYPGTLGGEPDREARFEEFHVLERDLRGEREPGQPKISVLAPVSRHAYPASTGRDVRWSLEHRGSGAASDPRTV